MPRDPGHGPSSPRAVVVRTRRPGLQLLPRHRRPDTLGQERDAQVGDEGAGGGGGGGAPRRAPPPPPPPPPPPRVDQDVVQRQPRLREPDRAPGRAQPA